MSQTQRDPIHSFHSIWLDWPTTTPTTWTWKRCKLWCLVCALSTGLWWSCRELTFFTTLPPLTTTTKTQWQRHIPHKQGHRFVHHQNTSKLVQKPICIQNMQLIMGIEMNLIGDWWERFTMMVMIHSGNVPTNRFAIVCNAQAWWQVIQSQWIITAVKCVSSPLEHALEVILVGWLAGLFAKWNTWKVSLLALCQASELLINCILLVFNSWTHPKTNLQT